MKKKKNTKAKTWLRKWHLKKSHFFF